MDGENTPAWGAGFTVPASIGNFVWDDGPKATDNGIRDDGENGIPGVTVILYDAAGDEVDRTTTAADGSYQFSGLIPGEYSLEFSVPTGFKGFTVQNRTEAAMRPPPACTARDAPNARLNKSRSTLRESQPSCFFVNFVDECAVFKLTSL